MKHYEELLDLLQDGFLSTVNTLANWCACRLYIVFLCGWRFSVDEVMVDRRLSEAQGQSCSKFYCPVHFRSKQEKPFHKVCKLNMTHIDIHELCWELPGSLLGVIHSKSSRKA